jgi:hypothetical protein
MSIFRWMCLLLATAAVAYAEDCRIEKMPTSWAFDHPPGTLEENHVQVNGVGRVSTTFYLRLRKPVALDAIAMVVEFTDDQSREIASVPLAGTLQKVTKSFNPPFAAQFHQHWATSSTRPLLSGMLDGALANTCPTHAAVTFALLRLADGTVEKFSSLGWHVGPMPHVVPLLPVTYPDVPVTPPLTFAGRISIDRIGKVKDVTPESEVPPEVFAWIKDQIQQLWSFHPALTDGQPRDSVMDVLFRFPADTRLEVPESDRPTTHQPMSVIQFFHSPDGSRRFIVMYGTLSEDRID